MKYVIIALLGLSVFIAINASQHEMYEARIGDRVRVQRHNSQVSVGYIEQLFFFRKDDSKKNIVHLLSCALSNQPALKKYVNEQSLKDSLACQDEYGFAPRSFVMIGVCLVSNDETAEFVLEKDLKQLRSIPELRPPNKPSQQTVYEKCESCILKIKKATIGM